MLWGEESPVEDRFMSLAVWPGTNHFALLSLSLLICKTELIILTLTVHDEN